MTSSWSSTFFSSGSYPVAITVLVVVCSRVAEQVYSQVSVVSNSLLSLASPDTNSGLHFASVTVTLLSGEIPVLVTV